MFLKRLFAPSPPPFKFSADLPDDEPSRLREVIGDCLSRKGGTVATARRTNALAALFSKLSPAGKARFASQVEALDEDGPEAVLRSYADIEEAELFGRASDRMAIFDALEPRRRRLLAMLADTPDGPPLLAEIAILAPRLRADVSTVLADRN